MRMRDGDREIIWLSQNHILRQWLRAALWWSLESFVYLLMNRIFNFGAIILMKQFNSKLMRAFFSKLKKHVDVINILKILFRISNYGKFCNLDSLLMNLMSNVIELTCHSNSFVLSFINKKMQTFRERCRRENTGGW